MKYLLIITVMLLLFSCGSSVVTTPENVTSESDAIEMMASVFTGPYSQRAIKEKMDTVMIMYGLPISKDNYLMAANTLVSLRKEIGDRFCEIDIVKHMLISNTSSKGKSFNDQAKISARELKARLAEK